jgi:hypothetical protein
MLKREDLKGEDVRFHAGRELENWYCAKLISIFPNGHADLVVFLPAANGTWLQTDIPFSPIEGVQGTWYLPPKLIEKFGEMFGKKAEPEPVKQQEEVMSVRVNLKDDDLFVDEKHQPDNRVQTKPTADESVRKPAAKPTRL